MMIQSLDEVERRRPLLVSLAYRLTGRAGEAEDLVQESYVRVLVEAREGYQATDEALVTTLTRLCLDYLSSDDVQQAHYEGPWLPEPALTADDALPPLDTDLQRESISLAFLTLLDTVPPRERAAYLLHDIFGYEDARVASMLDVDIVDYRQAYAAAVERIAAARPRFEYAPDAQRDLTQEIVLACRQGDIAELKELLARDVTAWTDGGGQVAAASRPIGGRDAVARYLAGYMQRSAGTSSMTYAEVNSGPALLVGREESLAGVIAFDVADDAVRGVRLLLNPDKLAFIERQLREIG